VQRGKRPHDEQGLRVSDASFHCDGNFCSMTCSPFEVITGRTYELIGNLRVNEGPGELGLILESIDLLESKQFMDGEWVALSLGEFRTGFP